MANDLAEPHLLVPEIQTPRPAFIAAIIPAAERADAKARDVNNRPGRKIAWQPGLIAGQSPVVIGLLSLARSLILDYTLS